MRFSGYGVEKKRPPCTVAMQKPNEIIGLGKPRLPSASGRDLPVMKMGLQKSRFYRAGQNLEVKLVFQFSSGL
jgi:hypothetical protein